MVNKKKLNEKIDNSGLKKRYIAKKLGICDRSLWAKVNGIAPFKAEEQRILEQLLNVESKEESDEIFFSDNVTEKDTYDDVMINKKYMEAEWIPHMHAYRLYDPDSSYQTIAYVDEDYLDKAMEQATELGYEGIKEV